MRGTYIRNGVYIYFEGGNIIILVGLVIITVVPPIQPLAAAAQSGSKDTFYKFIYLFENGFFSKQVQ